MSALVIGLDASTTGSKAVAFDLEGLAVAEGRALHELHCPQPDAWEQEPEALWGSALAALTQLSHALGARRHEVRALALAHQRETYVLSDAHGVPLAPARSWMDSRARRAVARAERELGARYLLELTGKAPCTTPALYKLREQLDDAPELRRQSPRLLDVHAWLCWKLLGRPVSTTASADPLGLLEVQTGRWSPRLVEWARLDERALPPLVTPGQHLGGLTPAVAASTGLPVDLPLFGGAGDGQAAALGAGVQSLERWYVNLGSALVGGGVSRRCERSLAFRTLIGAEPGTWLLESDLRSGMLAERWLLQLCGQDSAPARRALGEEAARLPPGADGVLFLPYLAGVMNPHWDDDASGCFLGLRSHHGPAHLYRAVVEGLALEQRLALDALAEATGHRASELVLVGGGADHDLLRRVMIDLSGRRVCRATTREVSALGAALLAAVGCGLYGSHALAQAAMCHTREVEPPSDAVETHAAQLEVYRGVYRQLQALGHSLQRLRDVPLTPPSTPGG